VIAAGSSRIVAIVIRMVTRGRPKSALLLTPEERGRLLTLSRLRRNPALARRARIVLRCASGKTNCVVAAREGISARTVGKWRERFVRHRLRGLDDAPRTGAPRRITDAAIGRIVELTLAGRADSASVVSTRALADACGVSRDAVHRIWRTLGLERSRERAWRLPAADRSGAFVGESCDLVGLMLHPLGRVVALCLEDEACRCVRLVADATADEGATPSAGERAALPDRSHLALLVALARTAEEAGTPATRRGPVDLLANFLMGLDGCLPATTRVRLVASGFALQQSHEARQWLDRHQRFDVWFIPSHLAWIAYTSAWLARGASIPAHDTARHLGARRLRQALDIFCESNEPGGEPFVWFAPPEVLDAIDENTVPAFRPAPA
jgi:transposase